MSAIVPFRPCGLGLPSFTRSVYHRTLGSGSTASPARPAAVNQCSSCLLEERKKGTFIFFAGPGRNFCEHDKAKKMNVPFLRVKQAVNQHRLVDTAMKLIAVPSRTGEAGAAADCLAKILKEDGFTVDRPEGGHPAAPAVAVRFDSKRPGRTLQFDGHL